MGSDERDRKKMEGDGDEVAGHSFHGGRSEEPKVEAEDAADGDDKPDVEPHSYHGI